jgi:hypothetical protein
MFQDGSEHRWASDGCAGAQDLSGRSGACPGPIRRRNVGPGFPISHGRRHLEASRLLETATLWVRRRLSSTTRIDLKRRSPHHVALPAEGCGVS